MDVNAVFPEGKDLEISEYRQHFPICAHTTYLASCSVGALAQEVRDAVNTFLHDWNRQEPACVQYALSLGYVVGRVTKEVSSRTQVQDRSLLTRDLTEGFGTVVIALARPPSDECKKVALQAVFRLAGVR